MHEKILKIEAAIKARFLVESTGHDWFHIDRVRKMALKISETEGGNREIIELSALLHDISDHKFNGGDHFAGGILAQQILKQYDYSPNIIEAVKEIIDNISFKATQGQNKMKTFEGKIVQDADRIDALGAIGIARTFAYGGKIDNPIYFPINQELNTNSNQKHTIAHFYEKLLRLKDQMNTQTAKMIATQRHAFMTTFLAQFFEEWNENK